MEILIHESFVNLEIFKQICKVNGNSAVYVEIPKDLTNENGIKISFLLKLFKCVPNENWNYLSLRYVGNHNYVLSVLILKKLIDYNPVHDNAFLKILNYKFKTYLNNYYLNSISYTTARNPDYIIKEFIEENMNLIDSRNKSLSKLISELPPLPSVNSFSSVKNLKSINISNINNDAIWVKDDPKYTESAQLSDKNVKCTYSLKNPTRNFKKGVKSPRTIIKTTNINRN